MPRIRVAKAGRDKFQVAILPNNPSELPARMVSVTSPEHIRTAIEQVHGEWTSERRQRQLSLAET